jgi:hypothetical protein
MNDVHRTDHHKRKHHEHGSKQLHQNGPNGKSWNITVDVYLNDASDPDSPDFDIRTCVETIPGDLKHPILVFNNYERNGFDIDFQLWDNTGTGYKFPKKEGDAIWSQVTSCPRAAVADVLKPKKVSSDGLTLSVHNPNDSAIGYFYYTLRVVDDLGNFVTMDPGGVNNNGSTTKRF